MTGRRSLVSLSSHLVLVLLLMRSVHVVEDKLLEDLVLFFRVAKLFCRQCCHQENIGELLVVGTPDYSVGVLRERADLTLLGLRLLTFLVCLRTDYDGVELILAPQPILEHLDID